MLLITQGYGPYLANSVITQGGGETAPREMLDYTPDAFLWEGYPEYEETLRNGQFKKNLLTLLGDFWSEQFSEYETLKTLSSGVVTLLSSQYRHLLGLVLSSNIEHIPVLQKESFQLVVFKQSEAEYVLESGALRAVRFSIDSKNQGPEFLTNTLFSPDVVLKKGLHYDITRVGQDNYIDFYVELFSDYNITSQTYFADEAQDKHILFWASDVALTEKHIYERFGRYLYEPGNDSEGYKFVIYALMAFFTNTKTVKSIEKVLNILSREPVCISNGETVLSIEEEAVLVGDTHYRRIVTNKAGYLAAMQSTLMVQVGDVLSKGDLIAKTHTANDYISDPEWHEDTVFPWELVEQYIPIGEPPENINLLRAIKDSDNPDEDYLYRLLDSILKYNLIKVMLNLNYDNLIYYQLLRGVYSVISSGTPAYLHLLFEILFSFEFIEAVDSCSELDLYYTVELEGNAEQFPYSIHEYGIGEAVSQIKYDGTAKYNGAYTYGTSMLMRGDSDLLATELSFLEEVQVLRGALKYDGTVQYNGSHTYGSGTDGPEDVQWFVYDSDGNLIENPWITIENIWDSGITITIDKTKIEAPLMDFPIPIMLSEACGINGFDASDFFDNITYASRKRLKAVTSTGQQCYIEVEPNLWGTNIKQAFMHINVPYVSSTEDTVIHLYYNPQNIDNTMYVGDTGDPIAQRVWDDNFLVVQHHVTTWPVVDSSTASISVWRTEKPVIQVKGALEGQGNLLESIGIDGGNANPASITGAGIDGGNADPDSVSGDLIDGGTAYSGDIGAHAFQDSALCFSGSELHNTGGFTAEQVFTLKSPITVQQWLIGYSNLVDSLKVQWCVTATDEQKLKAYFSAINGDEIFVESDQPVDFDTWNYSSLHFSPGQRIALNINGDNNTLKTTGVPAALDTSLGPQTPTEDDLMLEAHSHKGFVDETRISRVDRSAAWCTATRHGLFDNLLRFSTLSV
jgi:hypothetical protein